MTRWDLYLRSPKGVRTYEAKPGMSSGVTIDLVWLNQQADDILIACLVDVEEDLNHHSDHRALVTVVSINCNDGAPPGTDPSPEKAWHRVDQAKFVQELKALISPLTPISTITDISNLDSHISDSIISALNLASPSKTRTHKHKAWWNPVIMGPLRRAAAKALKKAKSHPTDENRATYRSTRNKYFQTIETEKTI